MQCNGSYQEEEEKEEANKAVHRTKEQAYVVYSLRTSYVLFIPIPIPINGPARGKQAS